MTNSGTPVNPPPSAPQGNDRIIYIQAPPAPKRGGVFRLILIMVLAAGLAFSLLLNFVLVIGSVAALGESGDELREKHVSGVFGAESKVVVIPVSGLIAEGSGGGLFSDEGTMEQIVRQLKRARNDKHVVGVVLEVNSPGGTVTASDIILHEIELTKASGKRIVVWMGSLAASGGYYISCKADAIYASPTTLTGSIGVIMNLFTVESMAEKVGLKMQIIKCGKYKEMGTPFRDMNDEERAKFQALVDGAYARFKKVISEGRGISADEADRIADGAVVTAQEALERKLIDKIDYVEAALNDARGTHKDVEVVRYKKPSGLVNALLSESKGSGRIDVHIDTPLPNMTAGLYYLWLPGATSTK